MRTTTTTDVYTTPAPAAISNGDSDATTGGDCDNAADTADNSPNGSGHGDRGGRNPDMME